MTNAAAVGGRGSMVPRVIGARYRGLLLAMLVFCAVFLAVPSQAGVGDNLVRTLLTTVSPGPVAVRSAGDGSGRLFIVRQEGDILIYDTTTETLLVQPFLNIKSKVTSGGELGLLGLAFHPDFSSNGYFYVDYTTGVEPGRSVVERYTVFASNPNRANPQSARKIIQAEWDFPNHYGGDLYFGNDGYLYVPWGDPNQYAQNLASLLGKILRIDVDSPTPSAYGLCSSGATNYSIPPGNPFGGAPTGDTISVDGFEELACPEVWAYGLRNPWRISFDRANGDMYIGDVGQDSREEIDLLPAGAKGYNFGWICREGDLPFRPTEPECADPATPFKEPIIAYGHDGQCSVTGGFRYRGSIASLRGTYVYADFCSGTIWFATVNPSGQWTSEIWMTINLSITSFGEDEAGELYFVELGGRLFRIDEAAAAQ